MRIASKPVLDRLIAFGRLIPNSPVALGQRGQLLAVSTRIQIVRVPVLETSGVVGRIGSRRAALLKVVPGRVRLGSVANFLAAIVRDAPGLENGIPRKVHGHVAAGADGATAEKA